MFPAAQKTFKTKQKYSTNNNLGKRLHFFFDKNKTLSIIILASLILCLLSFTFLHLRRVQPNSNIRSLASHSKAILENKNPNFNVFFGERNTPDKQWVRFEAKASSENPFEESQKGFFGQILDTVRPKRVLGIEFSLEQAGTEKVKTSTEFIENVEPKEGDNPYTSSQKPHVLNTDVVDGIDIEYQILEGLGLKEDIIIKDLDLYTKECENITNCDLAFNEFVFNLKLDDGLILKRAWYTYKGKNTETYYFTDERGNYIGHFLPSWAIDSNGVKTHDIDIKVEEGKGNLKVKVVIDNDWLFSEERIFPIRIDPTIVHDTEIDFGAGSFVNTEIRNGPELGLKKPKNKLIDSNTVGYWTLDETGGSGAYLLDSSGNNNHGTPTGTTYTTGKIGGARSFDGSSYITVPSVTAFSAGNTVHSIEMWISPASTPTTRQWPLLLGAATTGNYHITYNANGNMYLGPWGGNQCSITPDINKWNHIVTTFDGSVLKCYKNGVLSGSNTTSFNFTSNALTIAKFPPNTGEANFIGVIDSLRISTGALPSEEIMTSYLNGLESHSGYYSSPNIDFESNATLESLSWTSEGVNTGDGEIPYNDDGLVAQWNFNNTSGTTLTNNAGSCGTSCNATLSNFSNTSGQDVAIGSGWTNIHRRWGNGALMFDGVDDYATLNSNSSLRPANNFSVEAWVKVSNNTDFNIIITHADNGGGDDGWTLRVADTGRAQFYATNLNGFSNQNIQSNTLIELNEWYYLVGVYDNSVLKIYVNGILDNTKIAQGDVRYELTDYVTIGRRGGTHSPNTQFFHGTIDLIRFSQRVLSPSEILSNYQAGNIEFQYRDSGNDGEWVGGSEEVIDNFENNSGWQSTNENTLQKDSTEYSIEGSYALKLGGGYNYNIDSNTVGYWTLDETGGNLAYIRDSSGNNNHGTPTGTTYTSGKIGGARSFNGSSDSITTGTSARPSNNFTVETWFTTNVTHEIDTESTSGAGGTSGQKYLFGAMNEGTNAGMGVSVGTNGISVYEHGDSYMPALAVYNGPVPVGWNHLAVTYINKTPRIYLNGKLVRTGLTSTKSNIYAPYHIGGGPYGNHSGDIDEVRISNIARTPEEIAESYRLGKDHYVNKTLSSSIDLTDRTMIPFWVASDRLGSNLEFTYGNSKYVNNQPDANTVGFWRLDEESGSGAYLLDSSGNNNHGTPTGTTYTSGKIGGARGFNGSSDYITLGNPTELQITGNQTISMWLKPSNFSDRRNPYAKCFGGEGSIVQETNGTLTYYYGTAGSNASPYQGLSSNQSLTLNQWNHIAIVRDFTNMKLYWYINGNLTNSATTTYTYAASSTLPAYIASGNRSRYAGVIDDVRIDNVARTAEEIRQIYEMGRRTHPIVVTFNANLKSTNLITGDDDLSFDITTDSIENIDKGEKIIIKENYNGTEYIAQGDIETINKSTGAITVSSWDSGSTSPHYGIHSIGFSTNATVFKWQKEYIDIRYPLPEDKNNISQLTFRKTTNEGTTFWIDNMKKAKYLTDSSGSTFEEVKNIQEAQYKSIFTTWDKNVSSDFYLTSVTLDYNDNNPPTAPTNLLTQGQTNPIRISTPTPYFSAIFNDPDTGDTGTKYQIQVNNSSDFSGGLTWDSGINIMTATSVGARSPNLTYAGPTLPMDGTTYYWRIKFIDYGGLESPWSSTAQFTMNKSPTAPTNLLTQGQTNPIRISTPTPYFSAIFNDLDTGDTGVKYQIQVNTTGNFSGALIWDSGIKTMTATSVGARSPNITYAGAALPMDGTIYYWRIKFVDYGGLESLWSSIAQFTMNNSPSVPTDLLTQGQTNPLKVTTPTPYFSAIFNDPDTGDTGIKYQIQVNVQDNFQPISMIWDSGIKTMTATSVGARSPNITYAGTTLPMDGTKYYWRIKFIDYAGLESPWSSTISTDYFILSGIPTASDLQTDGMTNPTSVLKPPSFSAIYNDPNNDNSSYYQIQVNTTSNFLGTTMWDSGKKVITLSPGTRSPWIPYAGTNLNYNGTKYYVRMKFWDNDDNESTWVTGNFTDNPGKFQLEGLKLEGLKID